MEKTTHILIHKIRFDITEAAYSVLDGYLASLKARFAGDENASEILSDIEARIAEKLSDSGESTITLGTVQKVVSEIGSAEDMDAEGEAPLQASQERKLYRNPDNRIIAGVSSGIATYIGIDPIIIRLLFVVSIFAGGSGVVLYILFWIFVPLAKTASQKLEMRGTTVTASAFQQLAKDRSQKESTTVSRILYFPFAAIGTAITTLGTAMPLLRKIAGALIVIGSFFAILGATIGAILAAVSVTGRYFSSPLFTAVPHAMLYGFITAGYVSALIPLLFILALGMRLLRYRYHFSSQVGFGLLGVWFLALLLSAVLLANSVSSYERYIRTAPGYQETTQNVSVGAFTSIAVDGDVSVTVSDDGPRSVSLEGRQKDMGRVSATVENGILTISEKPFKDNCAFCDSVAPHVVVHAPGITSIDARSGSVSLDDIDSSSLTLIGTGGSNINGSIDVQTLTINGDSSYYSLSGSAAAATMKIVDGTISAAGLTIATADITAMDSSDVDVYVTDTLNTRNSIDSSIVYQGRAKATHELIDKEKGVEEE